MRLSKQLFLDSYLIASNITYCSTTELLAAGPFYHCAKPGIPTLLPIGNKIFSAIEEICLREGQLLALDEIELNQLIPTEMLKLGDQFHENFLKKFIFLPDRMRQFHLLSTPEPYFIHLLKDGLESYRQLPLQFIFVGKFYRQLSSHREILKTREFKMLAGIWIGEKSKLLGHGMKLFTDLTERIAEIFSLPLQRYNQDNNFKEFYYLHDEGEEEFNGMPAISLAMAYTYGQNKILKTTYRTEENKNARAGLLTYGLGLQRLWFILCDHFRDDKGFNFPSNIRPFDIALIPTKEQFILRSEKLKHNIIDKFQPHKIMLDDRHNVSMKEKIRLADFLGIPIKILIKKKTCVVEYRNSNEPLDFDLNEFVALLNRIQPCDFLNYLFKTH